MDINRSKEKFVEFLASLHLGDSKLFKNILDKFETFSELICKYNKQYGLISDNDLGTIWTRHFQDSLMAMKLFPHLFNRRELRPEAPLRVIDIGSGSGFPGVPLAILTPSSEFTLLEPNRRRGFFLEQILVRSLNISNVSLMKERAEYTVKQNISLNQFNTLVTRAVSSLDEIVPITLPFLKVGGSALYWMSASLLKDEGNLKILSSKHGGDYLGGNRYNLSISGSESEKAIVEFKKLNDSIKR